MNVIVTPLNDRPVRNRVLNHHVSARRRPRPPTGKNLKFRELLSALPVWLRPRLTTQVAGKKGFNKLAK